MANYSAARIPVEAFWLDIDYMRGSRDFTFDPDRFPANEVAVRPAFSEDFRSLLHLH